MRGLSKAVLSASIIGALTAPAGTAGATPSPQLAPPAAAADTDSAAIGYEAGILGESVVVTLDSGSLSVVDNRLQVTAADGQLAAAIPMSYQRDGSNYPIATEISGRTATLTPSTNPADATPTGQPPNLLRDIAIDPNSPAFDAAVARFQMQSSLGVAIGGLVGTVIGATIGCIAGGAAVGAAAAVPTIGTLAIPGFLGGCLITGAALGAVGAVAGTILIGGPIAFASALLFAGALAQQAAN
ncbi:hypothetical protein [Nocardia sp. NPDC051570]|uniref:hypothetical protein n=1 Tax=Nocardia sp. NPDC051570 TaxID=3364324 RepID=UPI0037B43458